MTRRPLFRLLAMLALAVPASAAAQSYTIDTNAGLDPENHLVSLQGTFGASYEDGALASRTGIGQTFSVFEVSRLDWLWFRTEGCFAAFQGVSSGCLYRAFVAAWDAGSGATTGMLWESPVFDMVELPGRENPYFTPDLLLGQGMYLAYLLPEATAPSPAYTGDRSSFYTYHLDLRPGGSVAYAGGEMALFTTSDPGADGTATAAWQELAAADLSFRAGLTTVPEPASMALLGTGLLALAGAARRRRRELPAGASPDV